MLLEIQAGKEGLQADFSAYYTAGQSLNLGLSPYKNNLSHDPPIWDGIARSGYSRFLYPPLVAALFQPLAWLPYQISKLVWGAITLVSLALSLFFTTRIFPLKTINQYFVAGTAACLFFPVITHIERGQIDAITLLLITIAILLIIKNTKRDELLAGLFLVTATLLKLHCIYLLPFVLIKRRWHILQGYFYGGILIAFATMIFPGTDYLYDYARNQFPRISGIVDVDDSLGRAEKKVIQNMLENVPDGFTSKDGRIYKLELFPFSTDGTVIEPLTKYFSERNIPISRSVLSLSLFVILFYVTWSWQRKFFHAPTSGQAEFLYWQIPLTIILLTAPLTWVMNIVWLLPFAIVLVSRYSATKNRQELYSLLPLTIGIILIAISESNVSFIPIVNNLSAYRFVIGEIMIMSGLLYYLPRRFLD